MAGTQPVFDQINLVVGNMDATLAFYRRLGLSIDAGPSDWPPGRAPGTRQPRCQAVFVSNSTTWRWRRSGTPVFANCRRGDLAP